MLLGDELRNNVKQFQSQHKVIIAKLSPWLKKISLSGRSEISWFYRNGELFGGIPVVNGQDYYDVELMRFVYENANAVKEALISENIRCEYYTKCNSSWYSFNRLEEEQFLIRW